MDYKAISVNSRKNSPQMPADSVTRIYADKIAFSYQ